MDELIDKLIKQGYLKTDLIINAFKKINRKDFVIDKFKDSAFVDSALPIGFDQTISQPLTVAFMLELLQPVAGDKILDIGSGSGWQTALLACCVGHGRVFAIERIPELFELGKKNIGKYSFNNVKCILGDGSKGLDKYSPFDKIIVAASCEKIPKEWKEQLKIKGRLVVPVKNSIWLIIKTENGFNEHEFPGFAFVPLIKDE